MANENINDISLRLMLLLDSASLERVKKGISTPLDELERKHRKKFGVEIDTRKVTAQMKQVETALTGVQKQARLTWREFVGQNMATAMKTASTQATHYAEAHRIAMRSLADEWKRYKAGISSVGAPINVAPIVSETGVINEALRGVETQAGETKQAIRDMANTPVKPPPQTIPPVGTGTGGLEIVLPPDAPAHGRLGMLRDSNDIENEARAAKQAQLEERMRLKVITEEERARLKVIVERRRLERERDANKGPEPTDWKLTPEQEEREVMLDALGDRMNYVRSKKLSKEEMQILDGMISDHVRGMGYGEVEGFDEALRVYEARERGEDAPYRTYEQFKAEEKVTQEKKKQAVEAVKAAKTEKERANALKTYAQTVVQTSKVTTKANTDDIKQANDRIRLLRIEAQMYTRRAEVAMRGAARLEQIGRTATIAGTALTLGIFAEANRYASGAKKPTEATEAWTRATNELTRARVRVDEVIIRQSLPIMNQIAKIATQTAGWVERNPQIVQAALKAGIILMGIGGVASLVAKGLRVYADLQYTTAVGLQMQASKIHLEASKNELLAAGIKKGDSDVNLPKGPGLTGRLAGAGLLTQAGGATLLGGGLAVTLGGIIGAGINDAITRVTGKGAYTNQFATVGAMNAGNNIFGPIAQMFDKGLDTKEIERKSTVFAAIIGKLTGAIDENSPLWTRAAASVKTASGAIADGIGKLEGSMNEEAIVAAFTKWKEDDARMVREAAEERKKIIADTEKQIADITRNYARQVIDINRQANANRTSITVAYQEQVAEAEQNYQEQRAEMIREANEAELEMEQDLQEQLRKLREDHEVRMDELARNRDALGLVKEKRAYDREKAEAERESNLEAQRRRKELNQRLQDLDTQYAQERQKRQEEYQQQLAENEARRAEELQRAAQQKAEEIQQLREAQAAKLKELQDGLNAERLRRREVFIQEIKDLDASLLGERNTKIKYYGLMLQDAEKWLSDYRAAMLRGLNVASTGATAQTRDSGGYMTKGLYAIAQNGLKEFVLDNQTTRAAERMIGSSLTQQGILAAMNGGSRQQVVYNDMRRMEAPLSVDAREMYQKGAEEALNKMMGPNYGR